MLRVVFSRYTLALEPRMLKLMVFPLSLLSVVPTCPAPC